jgi:hypothetical protein
MSRNGTVEEWQKNNSNHPQIELHQITKRVRLLLMVGTSEMLVEDVIHGEESTNILFICCMNNIRINSWR